MPVTDLEQKLGILMALAADDRDGRPPPPRLRHATESGALGPLNIRNLRTGPGRRTRLLRVLMTNACSFTAGARGSSSPRAFRAGRRMSPMN